MNEPQEGVQPDLSDLPPSALPWFTAATTYAAETWAAMFLGGDWTKADAAYTDMLTEEARFRASFLAASSGAATELEYYGEAS